MFWVEMEEQSYKQWLKAWSTKIFVFVLILYILYLVQWIGYPSFSSKYPFLQTSEYCMEYLLSGTLYGGQPYCIQTPVTYILATSLTLLFGSYALGSLVFYFLALFLVTVFLHKVAKRELGKESFLFITTLSLFFFGKLFIDDFASIPATLFLIMGFYFFWYKQGLFFKGLGSIFLALSLFSKTHTPIVILPILFFYLLNRYLCFRKESTTKSISAFLLQSKKELFVIILSFIIVFFALLLLFPNMITYVYAVHSYNQTVQPLSSIIHDLTTFKYFYDGYILLLYLGICVSLFRYIFYKEYDSFSFISSFSFLFLILTIGSKFSLIKITDTLRYFLPVAPFYLMNVLKLGNSLFEEKRKSLIAIFLSAIIILGIIFYLSIGGFSVTDFIANKGINEQKLIDQVKLDLEYPLTLLPPQTGKILTGEDYYHRYDRILSENPFFNLEGEEFHNIIPYDENESLTPDMAFAPNFVVMQIIPSLDPYIHSTPINYSSYVDDVNAGNYSIIITTQNYDDTYKLLNKNQQYFDNFCIVRIPYYEEANNDSLSVYRDIRFQSYDECLGFANTVYTYYTKNTDLFCSRGSYFFRLVKETLAVNGMNLDKECSNNNRLLLVNTPDKIKALFFCFFLWLYFIVILLMNTRNKLKK